MVVHPIEDDGPSQAGPQLHKPRIIHRNAVPLVAGDVLGVALKGVVGSKPVRARILRNRHGRGLPIQPEVVDVQLAPHGSGHADRQGPDRLQAGHGGQIDVPLLPQRPGKDLRAAVVDHLDVIDLHVELARPVVGLAA